MHVLLLRAEPGLTSGLARHLTMQFLLQSNKDRSRPLPCPCPSRVSPSGSRALPWSGPGWSLALYWTIQTDRRRPGPAGVAGLGLCGLRWCWAPSWDAPPFPGCVQCTPDRKKLPEELKAIQNTLWIPLPPCGPIRLTSLKGETPKYPFVTNW